MGTAEQSREQIVALHQASAREADATIAALELESPGRVPWWRPDKADVTLGRIMVHMIAETAHHAGHADIVREMRSARTTDRTAEWTGGSGGFRSSGAGGRPDARTA